MKNKSYKFASLFCTVLLFCSCGGGGGSSNTPKLSSMDISDATNLFVAQVAPSSSSKGNPATATVVSKLYKVTADGVVKEVTYRDQNGNEYTIDYYSCQAWNVDSTYIIAGFGSTCASSALYGEVYLARKTDGAVFVMPPDSQPQNNLYLGNTPDIYKDSASNMYYLASGLSIGSTAFDIVSKFLIADLSNIVLKAISSPNDTVLAFTTAPNGDVVYNGQDSSSNGVCRVVTPSNHVADISECSGGSNANFWIGYDGVIYSLKGSQTSAEIIAIDDMTGAETDYGPWPIYAVGIESQEFLLSFPDRTLITDSYSGSVIEVNNAAHTPRVIPTLPKLTAILAATTSPTYYYIAGTDSSSHHVLYRVGLDDSYKDLLLGVSDSYEINSITVSSTDEVTFNALEMSDNAHVIGKIDVNGNLSILDKTINQAVALVKVQ